MSAEDITHDDDESFSSWSSTSGEEGEEREEREEGEEDGGSSFDKSGAPPANDHEEEEEQEQYHKHRHKHRHKHHQSGSEHTLHVTTAPRRGDARRVSNRPSYRRASIGTRRIAKVKLCPRARIKRLRSAPPQPPLRKKVHTLEVPLRGRPVTNLPS